MKFQNISIHDSKLMLCNNIKWSEIAKGRNSNNISFNWLKIKSDELLLSHNQ